MEPSDWLTLEAAVPNGLLWVRPRLRRVADGYAELRHRLDPVAAFEQALADGLDDADYDRLEAFFDGGSDGLFGPDAGTQARTALRDALERVVGPRAH